MSTPAFLSEYVTNIKSALRLGSYANSVHVHERRRLEAVETLSEFKIQSRLEVCTGFKERLFDWPEGILGSPKNRLTLILGETRNRFPRERQKRDAKFPMTIAATSDGVAACNVLSGALRSPALTQLLTTEAIVDEWIRPDDPRVCESNLVIFGSGEVNLAALFLNGLVNDFFYGDDNDKPILNSMGNTLNVGNDTLQRSGPSTTDIKNFGAVLLLKNPWNPEFRLLWISGLTGVATTAGSSLVQNSWKALKPDELKQGKRAIGLVFEKEGAKIVPHFWLVPQGRKACHWEKAERSDVEDVEADVVASDPKRFSEPSGERIFVCYAHTDNESPNRWFDRLRQHLGPLVLQGKIKICSDQDIGLGDDWHDHIQTNLNGARGAILLVSPAFLDSEYIRNSELPVLLKNAKNKGVRIIPVILRPCHFAEAKFKYPDPKLGPHELFLSSLQVGALPEKALSEMTEGEQDRELVKVAEALTKLANP